MLPDIAREQWDRAPLGEILVLLGGEYLGLSGDKDEECPAGCLDSSRSRAEFFFEGVHAAELRDESIVEGSGREW